MKKFFSLLIPLITLVTAQAVFAAQNEETAKSWQEQATSTRAQVMSVYEELQGLGDQDNATAKELIDDAVKQLGEGDKFLAEGDKAMKAQEWEKANYGYNMAWQYYVKAATAGLNARRILTGK